ARESVQRNCASLAVPRRHVRTAPHHAARRRSRSEVHACGRTTRAVARAPHRGPAVWSSVPRRRTASGRRRASGLRHACMPPQALFRAQKPPPRRRPTLFERPLPHLAHRDRPDPPRPARRQPSEAFAGLYFATPESAAHRQAIAAVAASWPCLRTRDGGAPPPHGPPPPRPLPPSRPPRHPQPPH